MQRDNDLPVPDPDGSPIHPKELDTAERRMLDEVHREEPPVLQEPDGDLHAARAAVERENSRDMTEDEAAAYRLAPEDRLGWLFEPTETRDISPDDNTVLERWESRLDWLELEDERPTSPTEERDWQEPERDRR